MGRERRSENRKTEERRRQLPPLPASGVPLHSTRIGPMARRIRTEQGLSVGAIASLTGISPNGVTGFEESTNGGNNATLDLICRALLIRLSEFHRRIEDELK